MRVYVHLWSLSIGSRALVTRPISGGRDKECETLMAEPRGRFLVGIDTGGTFTDLVAFDVDSGTLSTSKTPSMPSQPGRALLDAVQAADLAMPDIAGLVHGTTIATNALIERTGARVLLLVTAGHEDIPYIQRINRKTL